MNFTIHSIVAVAAICLPASAFAGDAMRLSPGEAVKIELPENPSTGYTWRIDRDASGGLENIAIIDDGHRRGAAMPGAPGTHRWTIRAIRRGHAAIQFVYLRPWEPSPVETRRVGIEIAR